MSSLTDFIVLSKIGEGAYSSVHKVKRISDGEIYALKKVKISTMKEKEKENSLNQVRILASISNQNIIGYKEAFFDEKTNTLCIIMEYAEGGDLEKIIEKKKRNLEWVPENQIWNMLRQVLSGLSILHDMNIIHRDIKCANIFTSKGTYKLGDLNVSKLLKQNMAYTQTGTPYYASPEVWNDKPYELKSDIWSLGCIAYEYCALKPPFTANSMEGLYKKVMKGVYPRIPGSYSLELQKFIGKCLQLDAKNRPTTKQLFQMLPSSTNNPQKQSSINLLSTIKVPRNLKSWRDQLPKSNYASESNKQETAKNRFGHFSQQKLKEIVQQKNSQNSQVLKKNSIKRITPEPHNQKYMGNYHEPQLSRQAIIDMLEKKQKKNDEYSYVKKKQEKVEVLPKLKVYSQPTDNSLLCKMREQQRKKKYNYNRPTWWG